MKLSELIWERIGFGAVGVIVGVIYSLVLYPILHHFFSQIPFLQLLSVFTGMFFLLSQINQKLIGLAALSSIFTLIGFIFGYASIQDPTMLPKFNAIKICKEVGFGLLLGVIASLITIAITS